MFAERWKQKLFLARGSWGELQSGCLSMSNQIGPCDSWKPRCWWLGEGTWRSFALSAVYCISWTQVVTWGRMDLLTRYSHLIAHQSTTIKCGWVRILPFQRCVSSFWANPSCDAGYPDGVFYTSSSPAWLYLCTNVLPRRPPWLWQDSSPALFFWFYFLLCWGLASADGRDALWKAKRWAII